MIRHVVMWKFRPGTEADQQRFYQGLRGLQGVIPQIRASEVRENMVEGNYDAVLLADFDSLADLEIYMKDPRHLEVGKICKAIRTDRTAVDYEV